MRISVRNVSRKCRIVEVMDAPFDVRGFSGESIIRCAVTSIIPDVTWLRHLIEPRRRSRVVADDERASSYARLVERLIDPVNNEPVSGRHD